MTGPLGQRGLHRIVQIVHEISSTLYAGNHIATSFHYFIPAHTHAPHYFSYHQATNLLLALPRTLFSSAIETISSISPIRVPSVRIFIFLWLYISPQCPYQRTHLLHCPIQTIIIAAAAFKGSRNPYPTDCLGNSAMRVKSIWVTREAGCGLHRCTEVRS